MGLDRRRRRRIEEEEEEEEEEEGWKKMGLFKTLICQGVKSFSPNLNLEILRSRDLESVLSLDLDLDLANLSILLSSNKDGKNDDNNDGNIYLPLLLVVNSRTIRCILGSGLFSNKNNSL